MTTQGLPLLRDSNLTCFKGKIEGIRPRTSYGLCLSQTMHLCSTPLPNYNFINSKRSLSRICRIRRCAMQTLPMRQNTAVATITIQQTISVKRWVYTYFWLLVTRFGLHNFPHVNMNIFLKQVCCTCGTAVVGRSIKVWNTPSGMLPKCNFYCKNWNVLSLQHSSNYCVSLLTLPNICILFNSKRIENTIPFLVLFILWTILATQSWCKCIPTLKMQMLHWCYMPLLCEFVRTF